jgi:hypothetical protein
VCEDLIHDMYFIMSEDPCEQKFIEISFDIVIGHIWLHTTLEDP